MAKFEFASKLESPTAHKLVAPTTEVNVPLSFQQVGILVLVHWQIKPDREDEFLAYWRTRATVRDRKSLVGEFLNEVNLHEVEDLPWVTWAIAADNEMNAIHYVNVGMWTSRHAFLQQISPDFGDEAPTLPFELRRRQRMLLSPQAWRIGLATAPQFDSLGVQ